MKNPIEIKVDISDQFIDDLIGDADARSIKIDRDALKSELVNLLRGAVLFQHYRDEAEKGKPVTTSILNKRNDHIEKINNICGSLIAILDDKSSEMIMSDYERHRRNLDPSNVMLPVSTVSIPSFIALKIGLTHLLNLTVRRKIDRRKTYGTQRSAMSANDIFVVGAADIYRRHIREPAANPEGPFARFCCKLAEARPGLAFKGSTVRDSIQALAVYQASSVDEKTRVWTRDGQRLSKEKNLPKKPKSKGKSKI